MRTTIDISDELFRQAKIRAIQEGVRLKQLIARYVEQGLSQRGEPASDGVPSRQKRSDLPIARAATGKVIPQLTDAQMYEILEKEDLELSRASKA